MEHINRLIHNETVNAALVILATVVLFLVVIKVRKRRDDQDKA